MTPREVKAILDKAIDTLVEKDHHLLHVNASERSVSHQLATHLGPDAAQKPSPASKLRRGL